MLPTLSDKYRFFSFDCSPYRYRCSSPFFTDFSLLFDPFRLCVSSFRLEGDLFANYEQIDSSCDTV